MGDNKEYYVFDEQGGCIKISDDVIASVAATACAETEGVMSLANAPQGADFYDLFAKKSPVKGIKVESLGDVSCKIDLSILVGFGSPVAQTAKLVQSNVKSAVEDMAGIEVSEVNVSVSGIAFKK